MALLERAGKPREWGITFENAHMYNVHRANEDSSRRSLLSQSAAKRDRSCLSPKILIFYVLAHPRHDTRTARVPHKAD